VQAVEAAARDEATGDGLDADGAAALGQALGRLAAAAAATVVEKPWGREVWWAHTGRYTGKLLEVRAGHRLSLQYHREKLETLLFLCGRGEVQLGERRLAIAPGLNLTIRPGEVHRVSAESDVVFMEVSSPEVEDVVRLEDRYGRAAPAAAQP
jgi:mannose-6-phosphate isomerase-like protein (cupin superfamily)